MTRSPSTRWSRKSPRDLHAAIASALAAFIVIRSLGGEEIAVNPDNIVSITRPPADRRGVYSDDVNCVISLVDGKFISTAEPCADIIKRIIETRESQK